MRRADSLAERASAAGDRVAELCGKVQGGLFRLSVEPEGAAEQLSALVEQALPVFQTAGDDMALYVAYSALAEVAGIRGQMGAGQEAYDRALAHARQAGHLPPHSSASSRLRSILRHDSRVGAARVARRERARSRVGPLAPCLPGRGAGDARSLRRGAGDPRRSACGPGGARRGSHAREHHRIRRSGSSSGRTIPPPQPSSEQQGSGCSRSWGNSASCRPRPGTWRRRSTRLIGSTRPTPGQAARSSSARATTR